MKKQISIICAMLLATTNPVYAIEKDQIISAPTSPVYDQQPVSEVDPQKLEEAILDVKNRINIDDKDAEFYYQVSYEREMNTYMLNWNSTMYRTYVKYGEDKNIYEYNKYENKIKPDENIKKLPVYTKAESSKIALEFLAVAMPSEYKNYKIRADSSLNQNMYNFYLDYYKDGIVFEGISASITVDGITGEVTNYYTNYSAKIKYDSKNSIISSPKAETAYKEKLGIKPIYTSKYNEKGEVIETELVYVPVYDSSFVIDAKTGEKISISQRFFVGESDKVEGDLTSPSPEKAPSLTEEELKEIEKKKDLKSVTQGVEAAKKLGIPGVDSNSKLESGYLYESYNNTDSGYVWGLYFSSQEGSNSVQLDAKTLELISFGNYNYKYTENNVTQVQVEEAKKRAVEGIQKYSNLNLSELKLDEVYLEAQLGGNSPVIYLNYTRLENGIEYPENGVWIGYDITSKSINSYSKNWYSNLTFAKVELADKEIVYNQIFKENKQILKYKAIYTNGVVTSAKLVYEVDQSNYKLPLVFDGETGQRIVQKEENPKPVNYSDINKSKYKDELEALLQLGIGFSGGELKPNQAIKQSEFLYLVSQSFEYRPMPLDQISKLSTEQRKSLEDILRQRGVLLGDEKLSDKDITKEEATKYLVRALGYEKIAKNPEIFVSDLRDFNNVSKELKGYVAIGSALKIIEKNTVGQFLPLNKLPRDEALKMIYNYLK